MIINKEKWLFVSTMKCATNTLYELLKRKEFGGKWGGGNNFHAIPTAKSHPFPDMKRLAPLHFSACRNPYDRAVSIWASTCLRGENHDRYEPFRYITDKGGNPAHFADFVHLVLVDPDRPTFRVPWLYRNQSDWQDQFLVDAVVQTEDLARQLEDLLGVTIHGDLPNENTSPHRSWKHYYSNGLMKLVQEWAGDDFRRFGYDL